MMRSFKNRFALDEHHCGRHVLLRDVIGDGLHQMRLSKTSLAVDEQWIVGVPRVFRHSHCGGVGEFVGTADDKGIEGIGRIQHRPGVAHGFADAGNALLEFCGFLAVQKVDADVFVVVEQLCCGRQRADDEIAVAFLHQFLMHRIQRLKIEVSARVFDWCQRFDPGVIANTGQFLLEQFQRFFPHHQKSVHAMHPYRKKKI